MSYGGGGRSGGMSSMTNDPETAYMRVFVGNINTNSVSKQLLSRIFSKYGYITAISIHRGFAFVQFNDYHCARAAATAMNGSMIGDQYADCNLAAEPKPNQKQPDNMSSSSAGYGTYEGYGGEYDESWGGDEYDDSYDFGMQQGWGVTSPRPQQQRRRRGGGFSGGVQGGRISKVTTKGKPMSSLTKVALGKSLSNLKGVNIETLKSDLLLIRDRVQELINTLDKAVVATSQTQDEQQQTSTSTSSQHVQQQSEKHNVMMQPAGVESVQVEEQSVVVDTNIPTVTNEVVIQENEYAM